MPQLDDVIPAPAEVRPDRAADFTINPGTRIHAPAGAEQVAEHLAELLAPLVPVTIDDAAEAGGGPAAGGIRLRLTDAIDGREAYEIQIAPDGVDLRAADPAGLFAAVQTLRQLLPVPADGPAGGGAPAAEGGPGSAGGPGAAGGAVTLPGGSIADRPRFAYRGVMLDVARHFFTVDEVKSFIDAVVPFKINHLHLHLTDDQGWRLEIPGWPRLTEVSGAAGTGVDGAGPGYYTRDHFTEIVDYAAARFVTIVPEIDMPGHVNAAQYAYPELTADGTPVPQRTDREVGYSSLVAGSELTYTFVEDVIREVAKLTPGPWLHIGGDEAAATSADDYRTFISRVLPLVEKYGKRPIGWHEMAAVDLPVGAVPQFWRVEASDEGTARAVAAGCQVIISPADRIYLDMKYDESTPLGLDWAGFVEVDRSYGWDPADRLPGVGEEAILGVEGPLWSETLRSMADVQTMVFPRLLAVAEIGWSRRDRRDWESFRRRLAGYAPRWTATGTAFHPSPQIPWP